MNEKEFIKYLSENKVSQEQTVIYISRLNELNGFLDKDNKDIDTISNGEITKFTENLVENGKKDLVLDLLRALINYANFIKAYDYIVEIIDISESYNAMDNLYQRVAEQYGEKLRNEIFED